MTFEESLNNIENSLNTIIKRMEFNNKETNDSLSKLEDRVAALEAVDAVGGKRKSRKKRRKSRKKRRKSRKSKKRKSRRRRRR